MSNLLNCWHVDIFKYVVFSNQIKILTNNDSHINYFIPAKTEEKKTTDKQTDFGKSRTQKAQTHFFWATQICQQKTQKTRQMSRQTGSRFGFLGHPIWNGKGWFCQKKTGENLWNGVVKKISAVLRHGMVWMAIRVSGQHQKHGRWNCQVAFCNFLATLWHPTCPCSPCRNS